MKKNRLRSLDRQYVLLLALNFIVLFAVYNLFLLPSYTSDHISTYLAGRGSYPFESFFSGRPISVIISFLWSSLFGINAVQQPYVQLLVIFLLSVSCTLIVKVFAQGFFKENDYKKSLLIDFFVLIGFVNPMIVEIFIFKGIEWAIGILCAVLAANCFINTKYLPALLFLIGAVFIYQSYYSIFLIVVLPYIFLETDGRFFKNARLKYIKAFGIVAIVCALNLLYVKLFLWSGLLKTDVKATAFVASGFMAQLKDMFFWIAKLFVDCNGALPRFYMPFLMIFVACIGVYFIWRDRKSVKQMLVKIVIFGAVAFCIYFCVFFFGVLQSSGVYFPQRIAFPIYLAFGISSIMTYKLMEDHCKVVWAFLFSVLLLLVNFHYTQISVLDFYTSNTLDKYYMDSVQETINAYEKDTGIEINTIFAGRVDTSAYLYDDYMHMPYQGESYNHKIPYYDWSDVELLNLFENEQYLQEKMPDEIYNRYFSEKDWNVFVPDEQLVFDGNKLYWIIF